jgi:hypothetical protein
LPDRQWAPTSEATGTATSGNFPQEFSHLALIEAAARVIVTELVHEYERPDDP